MLLTQLTDAATRHARLLTIAFFACIAVIGLLSFSDYGSPYDEGTMDALGHGAYEYVFHGTPWPSNEAFRHHGAIIEFAIATFRQTFLPITDQGQNYLYLYWRRFFSFLFYFGAIITLYALARRIFRHRGWAVLACTLFLLTPRIFAHGFYNTRDIPTLTAFALGILTLLRLLDRRSFQNTVLHAFTCALALAIRMPALILLPFTLFFLAIDTFAKLQRTKAARSASIRGTIVLFVVYLCTLPIFTIALWPFLWEQPLTHFLEAHRFMSMLGGHLSWDYIPVWMAVTLPPFMTTAFITGLVASITAMLAAFRRLPLRAWLAKNRNTLLLLAWFFGPILALHLTDAGIYLEWRHLYFLSPAFVLLAVTGIRSLTSLASRVGRFTPAALAALWIVIAMHGTFTAAWMLRNHPFEYMYFSIPQQWVERGGFLLDYWALSYRQVAAEMLRRDLRDMLTVYSDENIAFINIFNFHPEAIDRVWRARELPQAMYVMTRDPQFAQSLTPIHTIRVDGIVINGLYQGPAYTTPPY